MKLPTGKQAGHVVMSAASWTGMKIGKPLVFVIATFMVIMTIIDSFGLV